MAETEREIETKFDVAPDFVIDDLNPLLERRDEIRVSDHELVSTYFDTDDGDLLTAHLTLRRRSGTSDTGWQLKVPGEGFRTELRWPLDDSDEPPAELRALIGPLTHGNPVHPRVRLRTRRRRHRVLNDAGELRFEIADDQVWADGITAPVTMRRWHELEVELGAAGDTSDLHAAASLLLGQGAFVSRSRSKVYRALHGEEPPLAPQGSAAAVILTYLDTQLDAIVAGHFAVSLLPFDPEVTDQPHEAVHQMRVAIRRYRAALTVFAPLFRSEAIEPLEGELKWFAAELGEVRDREVLRVRLARAVEDLPAFLVVGPVAERIDELLLGELHQHADALRQTMAGGRYHDLLDSLTRYRLEPPLTPAAQQPAASLQRYVARSERALAKRMKRAGTRTATDEQLHSARKAGKRARYAAEAVVDVAGSSTPSLAKRASRLQTLLGEHQDSVVATALLRRIADESSDHGENTFTYGLLVGEQRRNATEAAEAARRAARE